MTPLESLGEIQAALFPFWAAQLPSADGDFQVKWAEVQTEVGSVFTRIANIGDLLYARRDQLVPEGRIMVWQIAQFMAFGPAAGAFGYGGGRGEAVMSAMARDYDADAVVLQEGDPEPVARWCPPPADPPAPPPVP
ncbi:MAG: hypothetical protein SWI22_02150 [Pseudomonadota bacterium]|nr:hypothetical protein [Pseudomonadota bacterium]